MGMNREINSDMLETHHNRQRSKDLEFSKKISTELLKLFEGGAGDMSASKVLARQT